jgi:hypothetical protein
MEKPNTLADAESIVLSGLSPDAIKDLLKDLNITDGKFSEPFQKACLELHYWQYGESPSNFTSHLFLMFQKADVRNMRRLRRGFPVEAYVYDLWNLAPTQDKFFEWVELPVRPLSGEEWTKYKNYKVTT